MRQVKQANSFHTRSLLPLSEGSLAYYRLSALSEGGVADTSSLPYTIKILLEGALRNENGLEFTADDVLQLAKYVPEAPAAVEIPFLPVRVLMQDFTGVPALIDLAALRSAMVRLGKDPRKINPLLPVDLIIDHSVQVDAFGSPEALAINARREFERNRERYEFLHWGQKAFSNFRVVPPASGICHQVNLEHLGQVVWRVRQDGADVACPDTVVGTDSHTTMINGLGILGWGVGGIEAEAALLGQPISMLIPSVTGMRLTGALAPGVTATDLVLTVTQLLRKKNVVGRFVEFYGPGLDSLTLPDRATISNMSPEYGATCGFFPVDLETLRYLKMTGRKPADIDLVERYCKEQGLFRVTGGPEPRFAEKVELDLATIVPCLSGPKRPQDRIPLSDSKSAWRRILSAPAKQQGFAVPDSEITKSVPVTFSDNSTGVLRHGDVVIAAITSCTNTSNPRVLISAGLLAKKAVEKGLTVKPFVKTSLAPGSMVVSRYLKETGLLPYLETLGFHIVGYGCTTCIGNSGPLPGPVAEAIRSGTLNALAVLSGNRNFDGRINLLCNGSYLCSPPLVIAFALSGTLDFDFENEPLGRGPDGQPVFLKELWPREEEINVLLKSASRPEGFLESYQTLFTGNETWNAIPSADEPVYSWNAKSTYLQEPPFFVNMTPRPSAVTPIFGARVLALLGGSVTTDHISPAGAISETSPAGKYLAGMGVASEDFNSYGSRRGNDRVMTRGTLANTRLRNLLLPDGRGGDTLHLPDMRLLSIHEAAEFYRSEKTPVILIAGADYGMGSSRDWAAKGVFLLGVRAVLAESFERIHRSNLIGMGVLPLQFMPGEGAGPLKLTGHEAYTIPLDDSLEPGKRIRVAWTSDRGETGAFETLCRIDTPIELEYYRNGGILHYVLRRLIAAD